MPNLHWSGFSVYGSCGTLVTPDAEHLPPPTRTAAETGCQEKEGWRASAATYTPCFQRHEVGSKRGWKQFDERLVSGNVIGGLLLFCLFLKALKRHPFSTLMTKQASRRRLSRRKTKQRRPSAFFPFFPKIKLTVRALNQACRQMPNLD